MNQPCALSTNYLPPLAHDGGRYLQQLIDSRVDAKLESNRKKMRFSVTDAASVGGRAIDRATVVRPEALLKLKAVYVPAELHYLRLAWPACQHEEDIQVNGCEPPPLMCKFLLKPDFS